MTNDDAMNDRAVERHDARTCHDCGGTGDCRRCDGSALDCYCDHGRCDDCGGSGVNP